ncbi:hypothetical protein DPMN_035586 [Dreissena polymorpha]|uniref:Uncharacterized protein n=1 Tax=Dreissena polymorpha TaxID=45954 RepID=A0A9D4RN46_DREPO|nr:hypothetical protein DPMN_035586 [Dreissena polymorpha]
MSKFHEDWEKNVSSRLFTCCHYIHIKKTAPLPGPYIHITNAKHVTSRVKKTTPPGGHVFFTDPNHCQTQLSYQGVVVRSPWLTQMNRSQDGYKKSAPPLCSHVFQAKVTIFELIQDIIRINHLSKFHEDRKINVASRVLTRKNALPPGGHVFQPTNIIFELVQDIIGMNLLTNDNKILLKPYKENASPLGSHVFQANTNLLTKFHEDWTINVASRELTSQMLTPHNALRTKGDPKS